MAAKAPGPLPVFQVVARIQFLVIVGPRLRFPAGLLAEGYSQLLVATLNPNYLAQSTGATWRLAGQHLSAPSPSFERLA